MSTFHTPRPLLPKAVLINEMKVMRSPILQAVIEFLLTYKH
jgi:hypothetical protein